MEYKILEENMDRLEKKLNRIAAKCKSMEMSLYTKKPEKNMLSIKTKMEVNIRLNILLSMLRAGQ